MDEQHSDGHDSSNSVISFTAVLPNIIHRYVINFQASILKNVDTAYKCIFSS